MPDEKSSDRSESSKGFGNSDGFGVSGRFVGISGRFVGGRLVGGPGGLVGGPGGLVGGPGCPVGGSGCSVGVSVSIGVSCSAGIETLGVTFSVEAADTAVGDKLTDGDEGDWAKLEDEGEGDSDAYMRAVENSVSVGDVGRDG